MTKEKMTKEKVTKKRGIKVRKGIVFALLPLLFIAIAYLLLLTRQFPTAKIVPFFQEDSRPLKIAHRGFPAKKPENSLPSFRSALEHGADILELDIFLTSDDVIVVHHDRNLKRTTGLDRDISKATLTEIRTLDASYGFQAVEQESLDQSRQKSSQQNLETEKQKVVIPTLQEVFEAFPNHRINIEIKKSPRPEATVRQLWELIDETDRHSSVLLASGEHDVVTAFRKLSGGRVATGASLREVLLFYLCYLLRIPARPAFHALQIPARVGKITLDSRQFISFAHKHGLKLHYWTIDDPKEMESLIIAGADGIMTNRIDLADRVVDRTISRTVEKAVGENHATETERDGKEDGKSNGSNLPSILFFGDSLTAGYGLAAEEAMPALIERYIRQSNLRYRVINGGRSGDTTFGGIARLDWYLKAEFRIRHLVIELGANDAMRGIAIEEIKTNLKKIVEKGRAFDPAIKIYIFQMQIFPNMGQQYIRRFAGMFQELAEEQKIILLPFPLQDVATHPQLNQADGIHPNSEGTRIVAENVWKALKKYL